jgi:hypothetical protein
MEKLIYSLSHRAQQLKLFHSYPLQSVIFFNHLKIEVSSVKLLNLTLTIKSMAFTDKLSIPLYRVIKMIVGVLTTCHTQYT